ncbi:MAG: magnesium transporter CorA family protein [Bacteroidales bacterium]|nr:magnesium transporter CorA family protein [Bacteroidales bacterium]
MAESKFFHITSAGILYGVKSAEEAVKSLKEGGFIWLNYYKPEKKEISTLTDVIGIHPLSVEDCFDEKQVPKIEHFQTNTFILFNAFCYKDKTLFTDEVNLFVGNNFIITISGHNSEDRMPLKNIEDIVEHNIMYAKNGPAYLMHEVLDYIVDQKYSAFDTMEDELEEAEESLMNDVTLFQPMQLIHLRRDLVSLRKSLYHEREILVKINRLDCPFIPEKTIVQYRDIYDHLSKFFELTETYREIETSLMELYTSLLNNRMTQMSNETNASVRRLTMIATVFMPLTLIAGIGGMSEWTMMTGQENWKISYPLFVLAMLIIGVIIYMFLRGLEKGIFSGKKLVEENNQSEADISS